jgi:hypothetical protein
MNRLCACVLLLATACSGTREANAAGKAVQTGELAQAASLIEQHHPWRATQLLAPLLRDPQKRAPDVLLVAADRKSVV